jgi:hypothetical protein
LLHRLRQEIKDKRRGKLARGVLLQEGAMRDPVFPEIDRPPYNADMAPCIFSFEKKKLRGRKSETNDELQSAVL